MVVNNITKYNAQDGLGFCLSRAAQIIQSVVDEALLELNLNRLSWTVLCCIRFDGVQAPSQIANFVGLERTAASRIISRLEKQEYVSREPNTEDGRGYRVRATELGMRVCNQGPKLIESAVRPHLSDISEDEIRLLIVLLKRIGPGVMEVWSTDVIKGPKNK